MKNNTLIQNLLVCSGMLLLNSGILKAQTTNPADSMNSNKMNGTEQEYINKENDQMDDKMKNHAIQDTARMMNHDMDHQQMENRQMDKSQMENQRMHRDTSKMQKEMIRSTDDKKPMNDPKLNTATPPKTTEIQPAKQDNTQIKQTRTTTTTTTTAPEKKKVMYLVPDSSVNKVKSPK